MITNKISFRNLPTVLIILTLLFGIAFHPHFTKEAKAAILYEWDFEGTNPLHNLALELNGNSTITIAADPLDSNNKVMKVFQAEGSDRAEVRHSKSFSEGSEFWIGFRMMRPLGGHDQFNVNFQVGPAYREDIGYTGLYQIQSIKADSSWLWKAFDKGTDGNGYEVSLGSLNWGKWDSWVMHVKYRADAGGYVSVWKNGVNVFTKTQQNALSNSFTLIKWGGYNGIGKPATADTEIYFDDVKIGDANSSYAEVAPKKVIAPSSDAFIRDGIFADENYGSLSYLDVKTDPTPSFNRKTYMKFPLTNLSSVTDAKLRVYGRNIENSNIIPIAAYGLNNNNWGEAFIRWNNTPSGQKSFQSTVSVTSTEQYYEFDVTNIVNNRFINNGNAVTIILEAPEYSNLVRFNSKQNDTYKPMLIVTQ